MTGDPSLELPGSPSSDEHPPRLSSVPSDDNSAWPFSESFSPFTGEAFLGGESLSFSASS